MFVVITWHLITLILTGLHLPFLFKKIYVIAILHAKLGYHVLILQFLSARAVIGGRLNIHYTMIAKNWQLAGLLSLNYWICSSHELAWKLKVWFEQESTNIEPQLSYLLYWFSCHLAIFLLSNVMTCFQASKWFSWLKTRIQKDWYETKLRWLDKQRDVIGWFVLVIDMEEYCHHSNITPLAT